MSVEGRLYGQVLESVFGGNIDWDNDTIKCGLTTVTYVPDQDAHDFWNDVTANEISGTGYTAGGDTLTNKTVTTSAYAGGTNVFTLDADDATWTTSTLTARVAVVYDATPATDATRPLICYQLSSADVSTSAGTFTVQWSSAGIITIAVTAAS